MNQPYPSESRPSLPGSRYDFWTKGPGVILVVIVIGGLLVLWGAMALTADRGDPDPMNGYETAVIGCKFDHSSSGTIAVVDYTVRNTHPDTRSAAVRIEYRDDDGHLVDADWSQTRWIGAGDTVRGVEMTSLDVPIKTGTCHIVGAS